MFDRTFCCFLGVFTIILLLVLALVFGGSEDNQKTTQEMTSLSALGYEDNVYDYVDPGTGVHYLIFYGYRKGGITPRLNPDGSIMIEKEGAANESK